MFVFIALFVAVFTGAILPETVKSAKFEDIHLPETVSVLLSPTPKDISSKRITDQNFEVSIATSSGTMPINSGSASEPAYNERNGSLIKNVAGVAIEKSPALLNCTDESANCAEEEKKVRKPNLTPTPRSDIPVSTPEQTTPTPTLSVTIVPLPTVPDPCSPLPFPNKAEQADKIDLVMPCLH